MSIENTNRVYDPRMDKAYEIRRLVKEYELKKISAERRKRDGFDKYIHRKPATCSQCKRGMSNYLAKIQIENKRENAPICIPCIEGRARKPL